MTTKRKPRLVFQGELAQPLKRRFPGSAPTNSSSLAWKRRTLAFRSGNERGDLVLVPMLETLSDLNSAYSEAIERRLNLLCSHFSISSADPDRWRKLALRLATQVVPGLMVIESPGAPREWDQEQLGRLAANVRLLMAEGHTAMSACRVLLKLPGGGWRYPRCRSVKTLYRRYQQARKATAF